MDKWQCSICEWKWEEENTLFPFSCPIALMKHPDRTDLISKHQSLANPKDYKIKKLNTTMPLWRDYVNR